jgi:DNA repair protein RadC
MKNINLYELKKIQTEFPSVKITDIKMAADFIRNFYSDDIGIFESSFILLLNNSLKTIGYAKISQGGITGTVIDVRIVAKYAIESLATNVIIAHNHPSGKLLPSESDLQITKKLFSALKTLDIVLQDHIILTEESYYSFEQENIEFKH